MKRFICVVPLLLCLTFCSAPKSDPKPDPYVEPDPDPEEREQDEINEGLSSKNDQFNLFFDYTSKIEIKLDFTNKSITNLAKYAEGSGNSNYLKNEMYHPCTGEITVNGMTNKYYELGVRMRGNTSRDTHFIDENGRFVDGHYCHFKISFSQTFDDEEDNDYYIEPWENSEAKDARKDRKFGGMKKIDLKWNRNYDGTFTKESYALKAFRDEGILAQHSNLVLLTINTETDSRTMVYEAFEAVDKQLLKKANSSDNSGDLYKCTYTDMGKADLKDYSNNKIGVEGQNYRPIYNLKTNEKTSDHGRMKTFMDTLNNTRGQTGEQFATAISAYLDIDNFLKYSALCWVFGLPDDLRNNFNNYYVYFNSENKALFLPYDNDRCLGIRNNWDIDCKYQAWNSKTALGANTDEQSPIIFRLISGGSNNSWPVHEASQNAYHDYCVTFANKYLDQNKFQEFTNQFYYSNKNTSEAGNGNDTFAVYAEAKLSTL